MPTPPARYAHDMIYLDFWSHLLFHFTVSASQHRPLITSVCLLSLSSPSIAYTSCSSLGMSSLCLSSSCSLPLSVRSLTALPHAPAMTDTRPMPGAFYASNLPPGSSSRPTSSLRPSLSRFVTSYSFSSCTSHTYGVHTNHKSLRTHYTRLTWIAHACLRIRTLVPHDRLRPSMPLVTSLLWPSPPFSLYHRLLLPPTCLLILAIFFLLHPRLGLRLRSFPPRAVCWERVPRSSASLFYYYFKY